MAGEAYGHVSQAETVEHALVGILELGEVDVLLDRLVLRAKLRQAARRMHLTIERGGRQAVRRLWVGLKVRRDVIEARQNLLHDSKHDRERKRHTLGRDLELLNAVDPVGDEDAGRHVLEIKWLWRR